MTFLRSALFNLFFFTVTFVMTLTLATPARFIAPDRILDIASSWARLMLAAARVICGIRLSVTGMHYLGEGAALVASRHQSAFDTLVWLTLLPRCSYVLKRELLRIPLFGPLTQIAGMIAVDRTGGASALRSLLRAADQAVQQGRQIVIFPEGTRADPGALLPLQPGIAALAARTQLPIVPVVTDSGLYWARRAFHKRPGTIHIRILPPIPASTPRAELMARLESALRSDAVENSVG